MSVPAPLIDRTALQTRLARALCNATSESLSHPLLDRIGADVVDRLLTVLRTFNDAAVLSMWPTSLAHELAQLERIGSVMDYRVLGSQSDSSIDDEQLALAPESLDLMVSVLALQSTNDLPGALIQARRTLRPDGLFIGVLMGGQTLCELRQCLLEAESIVTGGASPRVLPFADVRDLGGLMQRAGFALPVADVDPVRLTFATPLHLLHELRNFSATNVLRERSRSSLRRDVLMRAMELYATRHADENGRVPATIELVTLTGWCPAPDQQQPLKPGSAKTLLSDALNTVEHKLKHDPEAE